MSKKTFCALFTALLVAVSFQIAMADTVVLKTGKVMEGDIVEETDDLVALELYDTGTTAYISKEDIASINKQRVDVARGRIIETTGDVEVLAKGETEWVPAEEGMALDEGYSIRSGPDSNAVAVFAEQVITAVEQESEINLEKLQKSRRTGINFKMNLDKGQMWNDVGKLRSKRSKFYVETPQAVTGVRGTVFTVHVSPDSKTKVGVVEGSVDVRTIGLTIMPTVVGENTMTEVAANVAPEAPSAISEEYLTQWDVYKSKFQRIRIEMAARGLGDLPMPVMIGLAVVAGIIIIFLLSRLLRRRKA
jgi:hypothetical protein